MLPSNSRSNSRDLIDGGTALPATTKAPSAKSAEVWAGLADSLIKDFLRTSATEDDLALAEMAARKALKINPSLPLAHIAQARICRAKGDHKGALKACDQALGRDSTLETEASVQKAFALVFLGKPKEALKTAKTLDPSSTDPGNLSWLLGRAHFTAAALSGTRSKVAAKYYDDAIDCLKKCVRENPERWYVRAHLIGAYALAGRLEAPEAEAAIKEYREKFMDWPLYPAIRNWADHQRFRGAHHNFRAAIDELLRGLKEAQAKGFP
jgi:adenylate cyclase